MNRNNPEEVERLLKSGVDPNEAWPDGVTGLHVAMQGGLEKLADVLIEYGAAINSTDYLGRTPLYHAAMATNSFSVNYLLEKTIHDISDIEGIFPVHVAARYGYTNIVSVLVKTFGALEKRTNTGLSPLMQASSSGQPNTVNMLCDKRADVNAINNDGTTSLSLACKYGRLDCVKTLIEFGADLSINNKYGEHAIHHACAGNHIEVIQHLLSIGVFPCVSTLSGHMACCLSSCSDCKTMIMQHIKASQLSVSLSLCISHPLIKIDYA